MRPSKAPLPVVLHRDRWWVVAVVGSAERFTERSARSRRRAWLVVVLIAVLAALLGWLVWWSPVLAVREIRVLGASTVSADQVRSATEVAVGTPLARVSAAAVGTRVEQAFAPVRSVEVRIGWPSTLVVVVTERTAVAAVPAGSGYELVDDTGTEFATRVRRPAGLATLTGTGPAREAALSVLTGLPDQLRSQVKSVQAESPDSIHLVLADQTRVRWGGAADGERKATVVLALLARQPKVIDVAAPDLPTTSGTRSSGRS